MAGFSCCQTAAATDLRQKAVELPVRIHAVYYTTITSSNVTKLPETETANIPGKSHKMLHRRFVHAGKNFTDLQILGCEFAPKCVCQPRTYETTVKTAAYRSCWHLRSKLAVTRKTSHCPHSFMIHQLTPGGQESCPLCWLSDPHSQPITFSIFKGNTYTIPINL